MTNRLQCLRFGDFLLFTVTILMCIDMPFVLSSQYDCFGTIVIYISVGHIVNLAFQFSNVCRPRYRHTARMFFFLGLYLVDISLIVYSASELWKVDESAFDGCNLYSFVLVSVIWFFFTFSWFIWHIYNLLRSFDNGNLPSVWPPSEVLEFGNESYFVDDDDWGADNEQRRRSAQFLIDSIPQFPYRIAEFQQPTQTFSSPPPPSSPLSSSQSSSPPQDGSIELNMMGDHHNPNRPAASPETSSSSTTTAAPAAMTPAPAPAPTAAKRQTEAATPAPAVTAAKMEAKHLLYKTPSPPQQGSRAMVSSSSSSSSSSTSSSSSSTRYIPISCSVCMEDFDENVMVRKLPNCVHHFHTQCIDQWLRVQRTCPDCRSIAIDRIA